MVFGCLDLILSSLFKKYLESFDYDLSIPGDTSRLWVLAQEKINEDRKIKFFKTHNALVKLGNYDFTNRANSLGGIYIVRDPRNLITSMTHHYSLNYDQAYLKIINQNQTLLGERSFSHHQPDLKSPTSSEQNTN